MMLLCFCQLLGNAETLLLLEDGEAQVLTNSLSIEAAIPCIHHKATLGLAAGLALRRYQ